MLLARELTEQIIGLANRLIGPFSWTAKWLLKSKRLPSWCRLMTRRCCA